MVLPSWRNENLGSMVRGALWLESEVGEGNTFTKAQLRAAFPDLSQIDRRLRGLRDYGWKINTSRDDPTLQQQEQRYVAKGAEVWIPGQAKALKHKSSITAAQRARVLRADNFLCRSCGIGSGEEYGDGVEQSQLNVARRKVVLPDGETDYQLVTECRRCGVGGGPDREVDLEALLELVEALSPMERRIFAGWMAADQRSLSPLDRVWGIYRSLPEQSRQAVAEALDDMDN
ncbi:hypothetical protein ACFZAV_23920 [Streptomyces sp. NPDC008343]|uniref:hypothetical protein n=1 Tax=Streptomyces sp. NPDC008343 TaxID=3364828 RepID=UPI0036EC4C68